MRSRTSCFNKTLYGKSLKRFWPVWFIGALLWFLFEPMFFLNWASGSGANDLYMRRHMVQTMGAESHILWFIFSVSVAMAVFSWLYNIRSAGFTAALPVSRRGLFLSCYLSGLTILVSTAAFTGLLMLLLSLLRSGGLADLIAEWLLVSVLDILNFYGFAVLCAMLTGNLVIMPLCALALEFAAVTVEELVRSLMGTVLYGFVSEESLITAFSPLWRLCSTGSMEPVFDPSGNVIDYSFTGMTLLLIYAAAGVSFTLLAMRLFEQRRMETAGDAVAIEILKPVFRWCMGVGCGLLASVGFYDLIVSGRYEPCTGGNFALIIFLLAIGGLAGWFGADMLIEKSFRVFSLHKRGAVLLTVILLLFGFSLGCDPLGLEKRVPAAGEFDSVTVNCAGESAFFMEQESLEETVKLHESVIAHKKVHQSNPENNWRMLSIDYFRDSELVLSRYYYLAADSAERESRNSDLRFAERVLNLPEALLRRKKIEFPVTEDSIEYAALRQREHYYADDYMLRYAHAPVKETDMDISDASQEYFGACEGYTGGDLTLTEKEAYEFYTECLLPDLQEGTLGRVWLVSDAEYAKTVYNIEFDMTVRSSEWKDGTPLNVSWFYTVPTVNSRRTNAWLENHGVVLETYWDYLERKGGLDILE